MVRVHACSMMLERWARRVRFLAMLRCIFAPRPARGISDALSLSGRRVQRVRVDLLMKMLL